jgi:signal transduction histidine kinase
MPSCSVMALLARNRSDRVITGLASGIALRIGVEPVMVRAAFCVLASIYGLGVALYLLLYVVSRPTRSLDIRRRFRTTRTNVGISLIVVGMLIFAEALVRQPVAMVVTVVTMTTGVTLLWSRTGSFFSPRRCLGILLLCFALVMIPSTFHLHDDRFTPVFVGGFTIGIVLFVGAPLILRLSDQLQVERRARIRSEERSELSAQLHDSVLQTLTLIQRTQSVEQIHTIARTQERRLRDWMLGREKVDSSDLASVLRTRAIDIETRHDVRADVVFVGKATIDERVTLLLDAILEATENAARHSGSATISVYVEVESDGITASVRDDGAGFDVAAVDKARRGISESIVGRMERAGGSAMIVTTPGEGTEVEFRLPRAGKSG